MNIHEQIHPFQLLVYLQPLQFSGRGLFSYCDWVGSPILRQVTDTVCIRQWLCCACTRWTEKDVIVSKQQMCRDWSATVTLLSLRVSETVCWQHDRNWWWLSLQQVSGKKRPPCAYQLSQNTLCKYLIVSKQHIAESRCWLSELYCRCVLLLRCYDNPTTFS